jgi:hypothetical protein
MLRRGKILQVDRGGNNQLHGLVVGQVILPLKPQYSQLGRGNNKYPPPSFAWRIEQGSITTQPGSRRQVKPGLLVTVMTMVATQLLVHTHISPTCPEIYPENMFPNF